MPEFLRMPEIAADTREVVVETWLIAEGATFNVGDAVVTVETDKAVVDVEADAAGVLRRVLVSAGETVAVGSPIAVWASADETDEAVEELISSLDEHPSETRRETTIPSGAPSEPPDNERDQTVCSVPEPTRLFSSPLARRIARDNCVDLSTVVGTGPGGRIRRVDVEGVVAASVASAPDQVNAPETVESIEISGYRDEPASRMRQAIARRLTESKQTIPHFYIRGNAHVANLLELRSELNASSDLKVSVNDLLLKAMAKAHLAVPAMNVQWVDGAIRHFSRIDIAVAVATEHGLLTPVVHDVGGRGVRELSTETRELIRRAKERELRQDELEGGSISLSNLGMYGVEDFAAIISPPHAAILAVGGSRMEPVVRDGKIEATSVLRMTLAVDHRPVDGSVAAEWMGALIAAIERPVQLLV